jgi:hypothetical protein
MHCLRNLNAMSGACVATILAHLMWSEVLQGNNDPLLAYNAALPANFVL